MVETMIEKPVKERPILLSTDMARAWNLGLKTQTRRMNGLDKINLDPHNWVYRGTTLAGDHIFGPEWLKDDLFAVDSVILPCPFGKPGDCIWPREPWKTLAKYDGLKPSELPLLSEDRYSPIEYLAGGTNINGGDSLADLGRYRHARFMCRWMSRNLSEIVSVRAERLQDISERDALAEGMTFPTALAWGGNPIEAFHYIWYKINGADSWGRNPWVWRVEFKSLA
jgi:hypothetical protein